MFTPAAIRVRLEQGLDFLSRGPSDAPVRQQTLRKTIDWSYELLSPAEQKLFQRLSVFRGGWTLEAAEAVCNTRHDLGTDVVDALSSLLDKSLVQQVTDGDEVRFSMLETLREYALERLVESGDLAPTRKAQAAYCLVVAEEGNALLTDLDREEWLASCETEHDNMRAALDWLVEQNEADWGLRLAGALFTFWERREHLVEGRARCEALLKLPGASGRTRSRANILKFAAAFATTMGDFESADGLNDEAFEIYRELGDRKGIVSQLNSRGVHACLARQLARGAARVRRIPGGVPGARRPAGDCVRPQQPRRRGQRAGRSGARPHAPRGGAGEVWPGRRLARCRLVVEPPWRRCTRERRPRRRAPAVPGGRQAVSRPRGSLGDSPIACRPR